MQKLKHLFKIVIQVLFNTEEEMKFFEAHDEVKTNAWQRQFKKHIEFEFHDSYSFMREEVHYLGFLERYYSIKILVGGLITLGIGIFLKGDPGFLGFIIFAILMAVVVCSALSPDERKEVFMRRAELATRFLPSYQRSVDTILEKINEHQSSPEKRESWEECLTSCQEEIAFLEKVKASQL